MTKRRASSGPGLAGLTDNMVDLIERSQLTQAEAARLLGISKQAVFKALKARKGKAATTPAPAPAKALPGPAEHAPESQAQPGATAEASRNGDEAEQWAQLGGQAWRGLVHAYAILITEARDQAVAGRGGRIGPVGMNGLTRTLREAEEGMRRLGVLPPVGGQQEHDKLQDLIVTVLSPSEEDEIRAAIAEQAGEGLTDDPDGAMVPAPPPVTPGRPVALIDRLPEAKDFEAWIAGMVGMKGAKWLRQIVGGLGGQTAQSKDQLQVELLRVTGGDPERLRCLVGTG